MNLHAIVAPAIGTVNPFVSVDIRRALPPTEADNGVLIPTYQDLGSFSAQVQALTFTDLQKLDGMNIQGTRRGVYMNGATAGVIRAEQRGGDILQFPAGTLPEGDVWLCAMVLEQWFDWCKIAITLQNQ